MNDPAPFRLTLPQARALNVAIVTCSALGVLAFLAGFIYAVAHDDAKQLANASLAGSVLLALFALGLYIRRVLGLIHQRQVWTLAALTDPHTEDLGAEPGEPDSEPDAGPEIPSPRPSVDPEPSREDERE